MDGVNCTKVPRLTQFVLQTTTIDVEKYTDALIALRDDLREYINDSNTNPIMLRTAWHDAGSDSGANGSIRFEAE